MWRAFIHLSALYQSAKGEGQDIENFFIPPGYDAEFRPGVPRMIVIATDEAFVREEPNPDFDEVAEALRDERIQQIGLSFEGPPDPLEASITSPPSPVILDQMRRTKAARITIPRKRVSVTIRDTKKIGSLDDGAMKSKFSRRLFSSSSTTPVRIQTCVGGRCATQTFPLRP